MNIKSMRPGQRVRATRRIVEDGSRKGDPSCPFIGEGGEFSAEFVHAEKGELGTVVATPGLPGAFAVGVVFFRTGTSTVVSREEIEVMEVQEMDRKMHEKCERARGIYLMKGAGNKGTYLFGGEPKESKTEALAKIAVLMLRMGETVLWVNAENSLEFTETLMVSKASLLDSKEVFEIRARVQNGLPFEDLSARDREVMAKFMVGAEWLSLRKLYHLSTQELTRALSVDSPYLGVLQKIAQTRANCEATAILVDGAHRLARPGAPMKESLPELIESLEAMAPIVGVSFIEYPAMTYDIPE